MSVSAGVVGTDLRLVVDIETKIICPAYVLLHRQPRGVYAPYRATSRNLWFFKPPGLREILLFVTTITVQLAATPNVGTGENLDRVNE